MGCQGVKRIESEGVICSDGENELKVELPRRVN